MSKQSTSNIEIIDAKPQDLKDYVKQILDKTTDAKDFCQYLKAKHKSTAITIIADVSGQTFSDIDLSNIDMGNIIATPRKVGKEPIEYPTQFQNCTFNNTTLRSNTSMQGLEFTHCKMENLSIIGDLDSVEFGVGCDISNLNLKEAYNIDKCIIDDNCKISQVILGFPDLETFEQDMKDKIDLQNIEKPTHRRTGVPDAPQAERKIPADVTPQRSTGGITGFLGKGLWRVAESTYNAAVNILIYDGIIKEHEEEEDASLEQIALHENAIQRILASNPNFSPSVEDIKESDKVLLTRLDVEGWIKSNKNQQNKTSLKDYIISISGDKSPDMVFYLEKLNLKDLNFSDLEFGEVIISQCDFSKSKFERANLDLVSARDCNFSDAIFNKVSAKNANFTRSIFCGAQIDKTSFENTMMAETNFSTGDLPTVISNSNLDHCEMRSANLNNIKVENTSLTHMNMQDVVGENAILQNVIIDQTNLAAANLSGIAIRNSKIQDTIAHDANFENAIMNKVEITGLNAHKINFNQLNAQDLTITKSDLSHGTINNAILAGVTIKDSILVSVQGQQLSTFIEQVPVPEEKEINRKAKAELEENIKNNQLSQENENYNIEDREKLEEILQQSIQILSDTSHDVAPKEKLVQLFEEAKPIIAGNYNDNKTKELIQTFSKLSDIAQDSSHELAQKKELFSILSATNEITNSDDDDIAGVKELRDSMGIAWKIVEEGKYDTIGREKLGEVFGEVEQRVLETGYKDDKKEELIKVLAEASQIAKDNSNDIAKKEQLDTQLRGALELLTDKSYNADEVEKINRALESREAPEGLNVLEVDATLIDISGSHLEKTTLDEVNAPHAKMQNIVIKNSEITNSNLHGADISGVNGNKTELHNNKIENNDFTDAHIEGAVITGGTLKDCDISGANITNTVIGTPDAKVDMVAITADIATNFAHTKVALVDTNAVIQVIKPDKTIQEVDPSELAEQSEVQEKIMSNTPLKVMAIAKDKAANMASNIAYYTGGIGDPLPEKKKSRLGMLAGISVGVGLAVVSTAFIASTLGLGIVPLSIVGVLGISASAVWGGYVGNLAQHTNIGKSLLTMLSTGLAAMCLGPLAATAIPLVVVYNTIMGNASPIKSAIGSVTDNLVAKPMQAITSALGKISYSSTELEAARISTEVRQQREEKLQQELEAIKEIPQKDIHAKGIALAEQGAKSEQPLVAPKVAQISSNPSAVGGKWTDNVKRVAKVALSNISEKFESGHAQILKRGKNDNIKRSDKEVRENISKKVEDSYVKTLEKGKGDNITPVKTY